MYDKDDNAGNSSDFLSKSDLSFGPSKETILQASGDRVELPDASFVRDADLTREGMDLHLTAPDGSVVIIEGYFAAVPAPLLQAPDGTALTPALVNSFVAQPLQYADAKGEAASDESPVGAVQEVSGTATVTRVDGTVETIQIGTPIFQGDVIETDAAGAVNIVFIDETSFAVSEDARLAIDEYVFDPSTQTGSTNFSVLKGVFVFTSGMIGREDPDDVQIETPVGSIGIRGTIIAGNVSTGEITVVEGAIVLKDFSGNEMTLASQFETARFNPSSNQIEYVGQMDAGQVINNFSSISTVSPQLFSSMGDAARENATQQQEQQQQQQEQGQDAAPAEGAQEQAPAEQQTNEPAPDQQGAAPVQQQQQEPQQQTQDVPATAGPAAPPAAPTTTNGFGSGDSGLGGNAGNLGGSSFSSGTPGNGGSSQNGSAPAAQAGPSQPPAAPPPAAQPPATQPTTSTAPANDIPPPQVIQQQAANNPPPPPPPANTAPTALTLNNLSVTEELPAGTVVGTLSTTDANQGSGFTYTLLNNAGGLFAISGNQIVTTAPLNYEAVTSHTIAVRTTDAGGLNFNQNFTISVINNPSDDAAPNNAPVLNITGAPALTSIDEDITGASNTGTMVADLVIDGSVTDTDGVVESIAITSVDNTNGTWEYSVGGGAFAAIAPVSPGSALLLGEGDMVRFVPNANYNGTATFQYKAWDESVGTAGTKANTSGNAFSANTETAQITVNPFNDAPTLDLDLSGGGADYATSFAEDGVGVPIVDTDVSILDVDHADMQSATIVIDTPTDGAYEALYINTTALAAINASLGVSGNGTGNLTITGTATLAQYQEALKLVTYDNTSTEPTAGARTISITVADGTNNSNTATTTVSVTNTNDLPTSANETRTFAEDAVYYFAAGDFTFSDSEAGSLNAVRIVTLPASGTLKLSGVDVTANQVIAESDIPNLTYQPGANGYGTAYAGFTFQVQDNATGWSSTANTFTFNVNTDNIWQGTSGDDTINLNSLTAHTTYEGGVGNDTFVAALTGSVGLTLNAGSGTMDVLDASAVTSDITLNLDTPSIQYGGSADTLSGFERYLLGSGKDTVKASIAAIKVETGAGEDSVEILAGNITVLTGADADNIFIGGDFANVEAGAGADVIRIDDINNNANIDGGADFDVLDLTIAGSTYDFATNNLSFKGIELIDMYGEGDTSLTMDIDVNTFTANDLKIAMDVNDMLDLDFSTYSGGGDFYRVDMGNGDIQFRNTITADVLTITGAAAANITASGALPILDLNAIEGSGQGLAITDNYGKGFGGHFANIGDINGDGKDDLMIGREMDDTVFRVYSPDTFNDVTSIPTTNVRDFFGGMSPALSSMQAIGDFNGDGRQDYALSFQDFSDTPGQGAVVIMDETGDIVHTVFGVAAADDFGANVQAVGDVNGDGYDDILISAPGLAQARLVYGTEPERSSVFTGNDYKNVIGTANNGVGFVLQDNGTMKRFTVDGNGDITAGPSSTVGVFNSLFASAGTPISMAYDGSGRGVIVSSNGQVVVFSGASAPSVAYSTTVSGAQEAFIADGRAYIITQSGQIRIVDNIASTANLVNTGSTFINGIDFTTGSAKYLGKIGPWAYILDEASGEIRKFETNATISDGTTGLLDTDRTQDVLPIGSSTPLIGAVEVEMLIGGAGTVLQGIYALKGSAAAGYAIEVYNYTSNTVSLYTTIDVTRLPFLNGPGALDVISDIQVRDDAGQIRLTVVIDDGRVYDVNVTDPFNPKIENAYKSETLDSAEDIITLPNGRVVVIGDHEIATMGRNDIADETFGSIFGFGPAGSGDVASAGDFNGDGKDDIAIISGSDGTVRIGLGGNLGTTGNFITFNNIQASDELDIPVMNLGDFNGDGKADIAIAATGANGATPATAKGYVHVVYGANLTPGSIHDINSYTSTAANGFTIQTDDYTTNAYAAALIGGGAVGDFNGDGVDDMALAFKVDGSHDVDIYVLYGNYGGTSPMNDGLVTMAELQDTDNAFRMSYKIDATITGTALDEFHLEIGGAGDVNGDGLADLYIGMPEDQNGGVNDGTVYVVYGETSGNVAVQQGTTGDDPTVGATVSAQTLIGDLGNDELYTYGQTDLIMLGGGGNDRFHVANLNFDRIDGGVGNQDVIFFEDTAINLTNMSAFKMQGIEVMDMTYAPGQNMTIKLSTIMDMLQTSDTGNISFTGFSDDRLMIDTGFTTHTNATDASSGTWETAESVRLALEDVFGDGEVHHEQSGGQDHFTIGGHTISIDSVLINTIVVADV